MTYRTTRRADQDIIDIYVYGATKFGIEQAERYLDGLVKAFETLSSDPLMARERAEITPPVRLSPWTAGMAAAFVLNITGNCLLI